jgi:hypothetical protein
VILGRNRINGQPKWKIEDPGQVFLVGINKNENRKTNISKTAILNCRLRNEVKAMS